MVDSLRRQHKPTSSLSSNLDSFVRLGAMTFTVVYACGVIVVAVHLARYGIVDLEIVKTQYVLAGGLAMLYVLCPVATVIVIFRALELLFLSKKGHRAEGVYLILYIMFVPLAFVSVFDLVIDLSVASPTARIGEIPSFLYFEDKRWMLFAVSIASIAVISFRWGLLRFYQNSVNEYGLKQSKLVLSTFVTLVSVLMIYFIVLYGTNIHPAVKASFGGGVPRKALISTRPIILPDSANYPLHGFPGGPIPVQLIHENSEDLYFFIEISQDSLHYRHVYRMAKSEILFLELEPFMP